MLSQNVYITNENTFLCPMCVGIREVTLYVHIKLQKESVAFDGSELRETVLDR